MPQNVKRRYVINRKAIVIIILIFLFCGLSIFAYKNDIDLFNIYKDSNDNITSVLNLSFDFKENSQVIPYNQDLLIVSDNKIKVIDLENNLKFNIDNRFNDVNVMTSDENIIISEKNGNKLCLYNEDRLVFEKQLEGIISRIKVIDEHILVLLKSNLINKAEVYDLNGNVVLSKSYEDEYLIDIDYSNKYNRVVILSILARNDKISSKIDYFDIKSTKNVNSIPIISPIKNDMLATNIKIFNNGNIVVLGDSKIISLNEDGNEVWFVNLSDIKAHHVNIYSGEYIIVEKSTIKNMFFNKRVISTLDGKGQAIGKGISINNPIINVDTDKSQVILNDSKTVYCVSNGELIWSYPFSKIKYAKIIDTKALLVGTDKIEVIEVN